MGWFQRARRREHDEEFVINSAHHKRRSGHSGAGRLHIRFEIRIGGSVISKVSVSKLSKTASVGDLLCRGESHVVGRVDHRAGTRTDVYAML